MKIRLYIYISLILAALLNAVSVHAYKYHFDIIDPQFDSIARSLSELDFANKRELITKEKIYKLKQIAQKKNDNQLMARAIYWEVRSSQMAARPPLCISLLEKARKLCAPKYEYDKALIEYQLAGNYERMGKYMKAYDLLALSIDALKRHDDHFFLGNAYLLLTQLFIDIDDFENAKKPLENANKEYIKAGFALNRIYFFEAFLLNGDKQLSLYKRAAETGGDKDWGLTVQALSNISEIFLDKGQNDSASHYCKMAENILETKAQGNIMFGALLTACRIKVLYAQGDYTGALALLRQEEQHFDSLKGERFVVDFYKYLWLVNDKLDNSQAAYRYLVKYQEEYERQNDEIRRQDVPKARAREAIARRDDTINLLEKEAELSRVSMFTAILFTVVVVLAAVILIINLHYRNKRKEAENMELHNSLRQEALIYSVNRKNFEDDIKQKNCEISSSTLLLANKNEVLQQISDITKKYSNGGKIPIEYVKEVNDVIGDSLKNDDEWQRFKLHFDRVHPDFFVKLKEASNKLTENDLRLCSYIRIGMRAKQIAEMLSVSPDSVNSNRYRLRKKLGLKRMDSLDDFIRNI